MTLHAAKARRHRIKTPAPRRKRAIARLRSEFFARAGELAARYGISCDQVVIHLWHSRASSHGLRLRNISHFEDLVLAVACSQNCGRAWADLAVLHERTLIRRCHDCRDELEATVHVRRLFSELRRRALSGECELRSYAGVRPLRTCLAETLNRLRQRERRAMFALDPADSMCGLTLAFAPASGAM